MALIALVNDYVTRVSSASKAPGAGVVSPTEWPAGTAGSVAHQYHRCLPAMHQMFLNGDIGAVSLPRQQAAVAADLVFTWRQHRIGGSSAKLVRQWPLRIVVSGCGSCLRNHHVLRYTAAAPCAMQSASQGALNLPVARYSRDAGLMAQLRQLGTIQEMQGFLQALLGDLAPPLPLPPRQEQQRQRVERWEQPPKPTPTKQVAETWQRDQQKQQGQREQRQQRERLQQQQREQRHLHRQDAQDEGQEEEALLAAGGSHKRKQRLLEPSPHVQQAAATAAERAPVAAGQKKKRRNTCGGQSESQELGGGAATAYSAYSAYRAGTIPTCAGAAAEAAAGWRCGWCSNHAGGPCCPNCTAETGAGTCGAGGG